MGEWNLGKRLRRFRTRKGYSIYEVQRRTNYHYTTISKYERNQRQPSLEALRELAACYYELALRALCVVSGYRSGSAN